MNERLKVLQVLKNQLSPHIGHSVQVEKRDKSTEVGVIDKLTLDYNHGTIWVWVKFFERGKEPKRIYPSQLLSCSCSLKGRTTR